MDYSKARLALFLLLSFVLVTSARIIPHSENQEAAYMINDYPDPGANPRHDPFPPPSQQFEVSVVKGHRIKKNL
ncbi:Protein PSY3 [Cucumis melo var. makuwa]|uniref:Protein PSY3 n=1 Tax=Cucumis melo var. makuwa TaxID=1194695 RepID=A0A5A7SPC6_CUCMM|nr:Protein PSY3 [Cucumis melo var. makuwa]